MARYGKPAVKAFHQNAKNRSLFDQPAEQIAVFDKQAGCRASKHGRSLRLVSVLLDAGGAQSGQAVIVD